MKTDEELMVAYRSGDRSAFRELFDRYAPALLRVMQRDFPDPDHARDLVQQTFLQLHRARADYQPERPLRPWLYTIALNLKRQYFRSAKRAPVLGNEPSEVEERSSDRGDPAAAAEASRVRAALDKLADSQRDAIVLHWFEGLGFAEIAEIVGASESAVKVRAHRGYERLREMLGGDVTDPAPPRYSERGTGTQTP